MRRVFQLCLSGFVGLLVVAPVFPASPVKSTVSASAPAPKAEKTITDPKIAALKPGLFPRKPYRAWFIPPFVMERPELYTSMNMIAGWGGSGATAENYAKLQKRGVVVLDWRYGPNSPFAKGEKEYFFKQCAPIPQGEYKTAGIALDEWNTSFELVRTQRTVAAEAYRLARKTWPELFFACWVTEPDEEFQALAKAGVWDLILVEGYTHVPEHPDWAISWEGTKKRCELLRKLGVLDRTIICVGHLSAKKDSLGKCMTKKELRKLVSETKRLYPEMPGIAFYGHHSSDSETIELIKYANKLAEEFYPDTPASSKNGGGKGLNNTIPI